MVLLAGILAEATNRFFATIQAQLPRIVGAVLFLALAYVAITVVRTIVRAALVRLYPVEERLVADFGVLVVTIALWFGAALALLSILGMTEVAASLGTAAGFLALGISYALSDMIEDTVAGLYLLRDPDFTAGDTVTTADITGEVRSIGLRKSRLLVDGDVVVVGNASVEKRWRLES
jgi:small-conductance mechanosensitive channel